jgi:hypothetical protein
MKITRTAGTVTVVMSDTEARDLENHLLWDKHLEEGHPAYSLWEMLSESSTEALDYTAARARLQDILGNDNSAVTALSIAQDKGQYGDSGVTVTLLTAQPATFSVIQPATRR